MALLKSYRWPGNVRELRNAIERAVVLTLSDVITPEDLPERVVSTAAPPIAAPATAPPATPPAPGSSWRLGDDPEGDDLRALVARYEAQLIVDALNACEGSQKDAAARLGLPLRTLVHKMGSHGIRRAPYVGPQPSQGPAKRV